MINYICTISTRVKFNFKQFDFIWDSQEDRAVSVHPYNYHFNFNLESEFKKYLHTNMCTERKMYSQSIY